MFSDWEWIFGGKQGGMRWEGPRGRGSAYNGYVHVWATAPDMAPAASLRTADGFLSPSSVSHLRTDS